MSDLADRAATSRWALPGGPLQVLKHTVRDPGPASAELLQDFQCLLRSRRIGDRRAGRDYVQRVAEHVGDDQRDQPAGAAGPSQTAALDSAQLFPHRVQLLDVGSGRTQVPRNGQLVVQRDPFGRRGNSRRSAAGDQAQAQIVRHQRLDQIEDPPGTRRPAAVGSLTPAGRAPCRWIRCSVRTQSSGTLIQPVSCFSCISRSPKAASRPAAMPAPALPQPTTAMRPMPASGSR